MSRKRGAGKKRCCIGFQSRCRCGCRSFLSRNLNLLSGSLCFFFLTTKRKSPFRQKKWKRLEGLEDFSKNVSLIRLNELDLLMSSYAAILRMIDESQIELKI